MRELIKRLAAKPVLALELLAATFFVTLLNLASPLFVIQVLNRYVTFGFDGTLITLFVGMCIALVMLFGFRTVRTSLANAVSAEPDESLQAQALSVLARVRTASLDRLGRPLAQETMNDLNIVQQAYEAPNITAVLDAPFSLLYILAVFLLSPVLGFIGLGGCALTLLASGLTLHSAKSSTRELQELAASHRGQTAAALYGADTVRAFGGWPYLRRIWSQQIAKMSDLRQRLARNKGLFGTIVQVDMMFLSAVLYAVGAVLVVQGDLTVGALIGANILTARAFQNLSRFSQTWAMTSKAKEAMGRLNEFLALPMEAETGAGMRNYNGGLEFKDMGFVFSGGTGPLFESVNVKLEPGAVLAVNGPNGSGKTTLIRLAAGLLDPMRGEILADGVNLRQLAPPWWRTQIIYMPQEPTFLNASVRENILMANPDLEESALSRIVAEANLEKFLYSSPAGLDTPITDAGRTLPVGVRRRLALARALATDGPLVLLDEPTEGLDKEGCMAVYALLNRMFTSGKTIIAVSHDPNIIKGAHMALDLSVKPAPALRKAQQRTNAPKRPTPAPTAAGGAP